MPGVALAVTMSSGNGEGQAFVQSHTGHSFFATGVLRSTSGNKVYSQGQLVYNWNTDDTCGRWTADVTSSSYQSVSGSCNGEIRIGSSADAARFKVCRNINNLPDSCGSWSAKDW
jgi:hypothetical protein